MIIRNAFIAATLLAALPAAAQTLPGSPDPAAVSGGTYSVDSDHTLVRFEVDHFGITPYTGIFGDVTGTLMLDPEAPDAARLDITIPVAKVTTASAGLTAHLLRPGKDGGKPDFFGPAPAPARFVSTSVRTTANAATITGDFTLNGITKPVTLQARLYGAGTMPATMGGKENIGFRATATLRRSDFGIATAVPFVSDDVTLDIIAAFQK
ncbi:MAG: YceI family protein [Polymorphobacter sp.]|uniref:YceI family protein n=1 Tax=Polymorphobacter sp. TaxID=1909290 RepID=UPI003A88E681